MAPGGPSLVAVAALLLSARGAAAAGVELAPFAGVQYAGSVYSAGHGRSLSLGTGLLYGATMDVALGPSWGVEFLYSRQETELSGGTGAPRFDLKIERYLAGIQEVKGEERARFFGVFLVGITRFAPGLGGYDSDERFTLGLRLGLKSHLSRRFGLRVEGGGYFLAVESGAGAVCVNGACLFRYHASGLWQGDVNAGVLMRF